MLVTGETLLRLAAFVFLSALIVTHRTNCPRVVVVDHGADRASAPSLAGAWNDGLDPEDTGRSAAGDGPDTPPVTRTFVNRELVDLLEQNPWQLLNPSLVRAFGLDDRDVVTKIHRAEQPAADNCSHTIEARALVTMNVTRDGFERVHKIYVTE